MRIRAFIIITLLFCGISAAVLYGEGSIQPVNEKNMITETMQSKDTPKLIKQLITHMKDELEVDWDRFPELIKEVETYTASLTDPASVAILHSMLGEMYNFYFEQNRWIINQRTNIEGYTPEDIREWPANLFNAKITEELGLSLAPAALLQQTPASRFQAIMESDTKEEVFTPSLYDFLIKRAIDIQPTVELYQQWSIFRGSQPDQKAALWVELEHLNYQYQSHYRWVDEEKSGYKQALDSLMLKYKDEDFSTEILYRQVNLLDDYRTKESTDSISAVQYNLLKEGIKRFPDYERIGLLKNRLQQMEQPSLYSTADNTVYPGKSLPIRLDYRNVSRVSIEIYRSLKNPLDITRYSHANAEDKKGELVRQFIMSLSFPNSYQRQDTTLQVVMEEPGLYECVITVPGEKMQNTHFVSVSRIASVYRNTPTGIIEVYVTDSDSGKPIPDATVTYFEGHRKMQPLNSVKTDKNGLVSLPKNTKISGYQATLPGDSWGRITSVYSWEQGGEERKDRVNLSLITDRGLYRPGQTVFFKGIAYITDADNPRTVAGKSFKVSLRDANDKEVSAQTFVTNEFGSFNGEFTLPKQILTGSFTLTTGEYSSFFRVEEYKRPTFRVEFLPIKEEIAFGDSVTLKGKAETFSGASLQSGEVSWRITRRPLWPRMGYGGSLSHVASGSSSLNADGTFSVHFLPEKDKNNFSWNNYDRFEITATITDSKGESQESQYIFNIGDASIMLTSDMAAQIDKDSMKVAVTARTLNGELVKTTGTYRIVLLEDAGKDANNTSQYKEVKTVVNGLFTSGERISQAVFRQLASGRYRLLAETKDSRGRMAKFEQDFILYGERDKRPPVFLHTWLLNNKTTVLPGEEAEITFGTSDKDAYVLYELYSNGRHIQQTVVKLSNENKVWKIPFKEEYGDGVIALFSFVKEGKFYTTQTSIYRKRPDRRLTIKPETFRDRLLPGNKEHWQFRILNADSLPVSAEVLAGLYDASLDNIAPFSWNFSPMQPISLWVRGFGLGTGFSQNHQYSDAEYANIAIKEYSYSRLDWQGVMRGRNVFYMESSEMSPSARMTKSYGSAMDDEQVMFAADSEMGAGELREQSAEKIQGGSDDAEVMTPTPLRQNFNETAFFYPALRTNESGDVIINFTMPESNTTWKFQSIAHTSDLKYGTYTNEVVTSKPLMVLPNLPRFIRQGDQVSLSAQILNQSDKEISGRVRLELFDPATDQPIVCLTKSQRPFTLGANGNISESWTLPVPAGSDLIGVRIIADSEEASDGEQHLIPVLSNQLLITESKPFYLTDEGKTQIKVADNKSSRTPFRLTLEVSGNPVWYAVQALPTITQPENDNILSWFASYYSNTLAASMVKQHPRLAEVIRQWTSQGGDASTLLSNLEKNEELKNILLEETPWVFEAQNETEQKQRLSLLFDINRASNQRDIALQQLLKQQKEDGGWGWFNGFNSSRSITLSILKGMRQLVYLSATDFDQSEKEMQMKALRFLDESVQKEYESLKKQNKQWKNAMPSAEQIEYIYIRSNYRDIPESAIVHEAIRFYTDQAEKNWSKYSLYEKTEIMLLMQRNGKTKAAADILAWLRKTATTSQESGMYWANNRRGMNYLTSPIETHSLLMFAFKEAGASETELNRMKQWLLNQKRTQNWESVPATLNAVYAILFTGSDWLNEPNAVVVQWGDKTYNTKEGEAATGYLKQAIGQPEITSQHTIITVEKQGKAPAWGTVYNQYFEAIDKVTGQKGVLNVDKKLFVETNNDTEKQIRPVTATDPLHVGDKVIVRLTIRTNQDMEYVHLKDLRAGCFEPAEQLSGISHQGGLGYYRSPKDISENFFFTNLPKGTFVLEYPVYVSRSGEYSGGISTIQCMYAPEFVSYTEGNKLIVKE